MEPTAEIRRLLDVMPASGRMMTKLSASRSIVIDSSSAALESGATDIY